MPHALQAPIAIVISLKTQNHRAYNPGGLCDSNTTNKSNTQFVSLLILCLCILIFEPGSSAEIKSNIKVIDLTCFSYKQM